MNAVGSTSKVRSPATPGSCADLDAHRLTQRCLLDETQYFAGLGGECLTERDRGRDASTVPLLARSPATSLRAGSRRADAGLGMTPPKLTAGSGKKPGTGNPLHTQEPVTVASFRTWRGWREDVARDRCLTGDSNIRGGSRESGVSTQYSALNHTWDLLLFPAAWAGRRRYEM